MTLSVAWWLYDQAPDNPLAKYGGGIAAAHLAGMPYHGLIKTTNWLGAFNRSAHAQQVARSQYAYMTRHGMNISKSSHAHFARQGVARQAFFTTANMRTARGVLTKGRYLRFAGKMGARFVPGLGWALLAYDVYTVANMILDD